MKPTWNKQKNIFEWPEVKRDTPVSSEYKPSAVDSFIANLFGVLDFIFGKKK